MGGQGTRQGLGIKLTVVCCGSVAGVASPRAEATEPSPRARLRPAFYTWGPETAGESLRKCYIGPQRSHVKSVIDSC